MTQAQAKRMMNDGDRIIKVQNKEEAIDLLHSLYLFSPVSIGEMLASIKIEGLSMEKVGEVYNYLMNKF